MEDSAYHVVAILNLRVCLGSEGADLAGFHFDKLCYYCGGPYVDCDTEEASCGIALLEGCRLRVKDVDFGANRILVRGGKGDKDRRTPLPENLKRPLADCLSEGGRQYTEDLDQNAGWVELPHAIGGNTHVLQLGPLGVRSPVGTL